jgi:hypothetical protein
MSAFGTFEISVEPLVPRSVFPKLVGTPTGGEAVSIFNVKFNGNVSILPACDLIFHKNASELLIRLLKETE